MGSKSESVAASNSDALDPKPMRLAGCKGFNVLDDRRAGADVQEKIGGRATTGASSWAILAEGGAA